MGDDRRFGRMRGGGVYEVADGGRSLATRVPRLKYPTQATRKSAINDRESCTYGYVQDVSCDFRQLVSCRVVREEGVATRKGGRLQGGDW
jgi:hypothetical protein